MKLSSEIAAVVTGGASGLGAATARALAAHGVRVAVFDVNAEKGEQVAREIGGVFAPCDVTQEAAVDAALASARAAHGQERILVNCAGIAVGQRIVRRDRQSGAVTPHDLATFARTIQINLVGTFLMMSRVAAGMVTVEPMAPDGERGVMVSTASVAARASAMASVTPPTARPTASPPCG